MMSRLPKPSSKTSKPNPYKLHLQRAFELIPISWIGITFAQQVAAMADPLFDCMEMVRDRRFDQALPSLPDTSKWLSLYREHRAITKGIGDGLPSIWRGGGEEIQDELDAARLVSEYERANPGELSGEIIRNVRPHKIIQAWNVGQKLCKRQYKRHLLELRRDLSSGYAFEGEDDFGRALAENPAIYFYVRVILPAILLWQVTPQRLLRQARSAVGAVKRLRAVERLVRLDPLAMHLDEIREWVNVSDGFTRNERERMMLKWRQQGMKHGKFERAKFKAVMGALIQSIVERMGTRLEPSGQWHPASITAPQVRELFHAAARDRAGRFKGVYDEDVADMQDDSWSKQLHRYRPYWDKLIPAIPGPNSPLLESGSSGAA